MPRANRSIATLLAQADHFIERETGAVVPPMQPSTTFARDEGYALRDGYSYGRNASPTADLAEAILAKLEGAADALVFSSGMSAFTALIETLPQDARVVAPRIMYHGGLDWLMRMSQKRGLKVGFFDAAVPGTLGEAIDAAPTALVWIETPVNPTWDVIDIAEAADLAHRAGAFIGVDSTVAPPVTTRPLELGADLVFHSATKYLNGHSDVTAGVLAVREPSDMWSQVNALRVSLGTVLAPFEAWLLVRGMRTLDVRYERLSANALRIAEHFEGHKSLEAVLYPGLASHPGHGIARRQMQHGFGGMLSLMVRGDGEAALRVARSVELFLPATSLGGVESLIEHRATTEGPNSVVPKTLLRLSVGIEDAGELIADLEQALERV
jgi:cystathionine gamma-synthase